MAVSTWARRGGAPRFPRQLVIMTDERQDDDVRKLADEVNRSISEIAREAIDAGMPVLRRRAKRAGALAEEVSEAVA